MVTKGQRGDDRNRTRVPGVQNRCLAARRHRPPVGGCAYGGLSSGLNARDALSLARTSRFVTLTSGSRGT